jgi:hypothetical protein
MPNRLSENETLRRLRSARIASEITAAIAVELQRQFGRLPPPVRRRAPRPRVGPCGKQTHASRGKAEAALRSLRRRDLTRPWDGQLHVYECRRCRGWHTGHHTES